MNMSSLFQIGQNSMNNNQELLNKLDTSSIKLKNNPSFQQESNIFLSKRKNHIFQKMIQDVQQSFMDKIANKSSNLNQPKSKQKSLQIRQNPEIEITSFNYQKQKYHPQYENSFQKNSYNLSLEKDGIAPGAALDLSFQDQPTSQYPFEKFSTICPILSTSSQKQEGNNQLQQKGGTLNSIYNNRIYTTTNTSQIDSSPTIQETIGGGCSSDLSPLLKENSLKSNQNQLRIHGRNKLQAQLSINTNNININNNNINNNSINNNILNNNNLDFNVLQTISIPSPDQKHASNSLHHDSAIKPQLKFLKIDADKLLKENPLSRDRAMNLTFFKQGDLKPMTAFKAKKDLKHFNFNKILMNRNGIECGSALKTPSIVAPDLKVKQSNISEFNFIPLFEESGKEKQFYLFKKTKTSKYSEAENGSSQRSPMSQYSPNKTQTAQMNFFHRNNLNLTQNYNQLKYLGLNQGNQTKFFMSEKKAINFIQNSSQNEYLNQTQFIQKRNINDLTLLNETSNFSKLTPENSKFKQHYLHFQNDLQELNSDQALEGGEQTSIDGCKLKYYQRETLLKPQTAHNFLNSQKFDFSLNKNNNNNNNNNNNLNSNSNSINYSYNNSHYNKISIIQEFDPQLDSNIHDHIDDISPFQSIPKTEYYSIKDRDFNDLGSIISESQTIEKSQQDQQMCYQDEDLDFYMNRMKNDVEQPQLEEAQTNQFKTHFRTKFFQQKQNL